MWICPPRFIPDMDIELLKRTPSAFLGSCRYKLPDIHENPEIYEKIFSILDKLQIEAFIYIGGKRFHTVERCVSCRTTPL